MIGKQTTLDLNGPILSFTTQPQSVSVCDSGSATFVGIATAFFPTQDPPNPASNTGTLLYQWYAEGFGPLTDGTFQGASITGSGTTTLTITNAKSPTANGLGFYVGVDYVPSAYSQPVGSAVTVGTGRSTGNAVNEILISNSATLTVFPVLSVTQQPTDQTAVSTRFATFTTLGALTDTIQSNILYRWQINGNDLSDSAAVIGSGTTTLSIAIPNIINNLDPIISGLTRYYLINFSVPVATVSIPTFALVGAGGNAQPTLRIVEFIRINSQQYKLRFDRINSKTGQIQDNFCRSFTIQATPSSSQPVLQNNTVTHITGGSASTTVSIVWSPTNTNSTNAVRARLTHPTACNSPIFTNTVNFNTVDARAIIKIEDFALSRFFSTKDLSTGPHTAFGNTNPGSVYVVYAAERDIRVRITLASGAGQARNGFLGGQGGVSTFNYTFERNVEYVFKMGSGGTSGGNRGGENNLLGGGVTQLYKKARLVAACGGGGGAGTAARGGDGGGVNLAGQPGLGRGAGNGGIVVPSGTFLDGAFASGTTGGVVSSCMRGDDLARITGIPVCDDYPGLTQIRSADGTVVSDSAFLFRGHKPSSPQGFRTNGGNGSGNQGGGGSGAYGGNAAISDGSGGGGGSGYNDGSIIPISSTVGGNASTIGSIRIEIAE